MLNKATILAALARLAELLRDRGLEGEICLFGGTAMMLAFGARVATKDVDAIFEPTATIRHLADVVAKELRLSHDWLNDGAKGFVSQQHDVSTDDLPQFDGLRIVAPTAEYLLAMKCMASRVARDGSDDVKDIEFLLKHLGVTKVDDALHIVSSYYNSARVPPRAQFLLEQLLEGDDDEQL